jgi:uncharacterized protein (DUF952 family)
VRWLYHVRVAGPLPDPYAPPSLAQEGFIHCSFQPTAAESARLYFPPEAQLEVLQIDPRGLDVELADTPRGPMPHLKQALPARAVTARLTVAELAGAPDSHPEEG